MPNQQLSQDRIDKNYDRVITLIQYYVQLFWLVFGAFLLSETVLLGAIATIAKDGPDEWAFAGSIFGFILCIPWWTSFQYNHAFYQLRINEAKELEPKAASFFTNGKKIIDGEAVLCVSVPRYAVFLRPKRAVSLLIILFALAFLSIAVIKNPLFTIKVSAKPASETVIKTSPQSNDTVRTK